MLLVVTAQQHHWDLLCELLLCWDCLAFDATHVYEKAWDAFLETQAEGEAEPISLEDQRRQIAAVGDDLQPTIGPGRIGVKIAGPTVK